jgi:hypothetical protein
MQDCLSKSSAQQEGCFEQQGGIKFKSTTLCGAETRTLRKVEQKYVGSFEMWCWRRMEKISWTDRVKNAEVLLRGGKERNILHTVKSRKANWIGHIWRRNCLLNQIIEWKIRGRIQVTGRRGRRCKQLLDDLQEKRGTGN